MVFCFHCTEEETKAEKERLAGKHSLELWLLAPCCPSTLRAALLGYAETHRVRGTALGSGEPAGPQRHTAHTVMSVDGKNSRS